MMGMMAKKRRSLNEILPKDEAIINNFEKHIKLYQNQSIAQKPTLVEFDEVLFVFDYTTFHEAPQFKLKDCGVAVLWKEKSTKQLKHHYIDFFALATHDYLYTHRVWKELPHILVTFYELASTWKCRVHCNYFAPRHGHNIMDGHFGVGKKMLRKKFACSTQHITQREWFEVVLLPSVPVLHCYSKTKTSEHYCSDDLIAMPKFCNMTK